MAVSLGFARGGAVEPVRELSTLVSVVVLGIGCAANPWGCAFGVVGA